MYSMQLHRHGHFEMFTTLKRFDTVWDCWFCRHHDFTANNFCKHNKATKIQLIKCVFGSTFAHKYWESAAFLCISVLLTWIIMYIFIFKKRSVLNKGEKHLSSKKRAGGIDCNRRLAHPFGYRLWKLFGPRKPSVYDFCLLCFAQNFQGCFYETWNPLHDSPYVNTEIPDLCLMWFDRLDLNVLSTCCIPIHISTRQLWSDHPGWFVINVDMDGK